MNDNNYQADAALDEHAIAIVGMAGRFPGAANVDQYWRNLRDGVESIVTYARDDLVAAGVPESSLNDPDYVPRGAPLQDMEMFDAAFFGFNPREGSLLDPQHRHFLELCWAALEDAGQDPARFQGAIGVFAGSGHNAYMPYNLFTNPQLMDSVGMFLVRHTGNDKDFMTTRVSYCLDLKGPSINVQTACSTSLVAVHMACQSLLADECDMALAGGVTIELPHRLGYRYEEGEILSPDGHCRAFDADAKGTVFGSGAGVVVLRRLEEALTDGDQIHAVIRGTAINNDGAGKVGYLAPSVDGQAACIAEALAVSGVGADSISYIETHGTGTPVGDPIEIAALSQAFRAQTDKSGYCAIGSVKTNIGHLDTAAGVASLIKVVQALKHRQLPPSLNFQQANPAIDFAASPFYVNTELVAWETGRQPRRAGISSLGVGGTNAHVIVEEAPPLLSSGASRPWQLLLLSAKSAAALARRATDFLEYLQSPNVAALGDVAYTLTLGRQPMSQRMALVCNGQSQAVELLKGGEHKPRRGEAPETARKIAFMFAGGGAQFPGMAADLFQDEPLFREELQTCLNLLKPQVDYDPFAILYPAESGREGSEQNFERPSIALPLLFSVQYAQAKLWLSWGIEPTAYIGHSMGEYTAACLAGVFSLKDAIGLVVLRGKLFEQVAAGGMLSVPLPAADLRGFIGDDLSLAAVNAEELCVLSGPVARIDRLQEELASKQIDFTRIHIQIAAHSHMLESILAPFRDYWNNVNLHPPRRPMISNLTGDWLTAEQAVDPEYWVSHLRNTVQFAAGVATLMRNQDMALLEVGPGRTLASLAGMHPDRGGRPVFSSQRHPSEAINDYAFMLEVLGQLWIAGIAWDSEIFYQGEHRHKVSLPTYPFEMSRFWIEPGVERGVTVTPSPATGLGRQADLEDWFYRPVWKNEPLPVETVDKPERILLFARKGQLLDQEIKARLTSMCEALLLVEPGVNYSASDEGFQVCPGKPGDMVELIGELRDKARLPSLVVYLWGLAEEGLNEHQVACPEQRQFFPLLDLARALGDQGDGRVMRWYLLSDGLQQIGSEQVPSPEQGLMMGPCRVIPKEFPNIRCTNLDFRQTGSFKDQAARICREFTNVLSPPVVLQRGLDRWVEEYQPVPREWFEGGEEWLAGAGCYLITGGLGGLGLTTALALANKGAKNIVLLGRSGVPARAEWDALLKEAKEHPGPVRRIRGIKAIEELGARVDLREISVTDEKGMTALLAELRQQYGLISGLVHAAGAIEDAVIQLKDHESASRVLAAKVQGTRILDRLLADDELEFIWLYSSVSGLEGLVGQVDYAAANAFLDAYARSRWALGRPVIALDWTTWQRVGMAAELAVELGLVDETEERIGLSPLVTLNTDTSWILDEHRLIDGRAILPGTGYLDLLYKAFTVEGKTRDFAIEDLVFIQPFMVDDHEDKGLYLDIESEGGRFALFSDSEGDERRLHVTGNLVWFKESPPTSNDIEPLNIKALTQRCSQRVSELGGRVDHPHLTLGPRWHNIMTIRYGEGAALVELELPQDLVSDLTDHPLHPALLDMATGTLQQLIAGFDPESDFYVPLSYGSMRVYSPLKSKVFSYVRLNEQQDENRETVTFDVSICDAVGRVLVEITDFSMKRTSGSSFSAQPAVSARPKAAETQKRPLNTGNRILDIGLHEGILPEEGVELLGRVLGASSMPQLIVSPQPFHGLLDEIRATGIISSEIKEPVARGVGVDNRPNTLGSEYLQPEGEVEARIAKLWEDALGISPIGRHDDFYELGGHSLLLTQLATRTRREFNCAAPLATLFASPSPARWGAVFVAAQEDSRVGDGEQKTKSKISRVSRDKYRTGGASETE